MSHLLEPNVTVLYFARHHHASLANEKRYCRPTPHRKPRAIIDIPTLGSFSMQSIQSAPWANNLAASPPASPTDTRFTNNNAISKSKAKSNILINTNTNVGARRKSSLGNPAWSPSIIHDLDDNIVSPTTLLSRRPFSSIGSNLRLAAAMEEKDLQPQPGLSPWTSNMSAASPNGLLSPRSAETSNNASVDGAESAKNPFSYQTVSYTTENLRRDPKLVRMVTCSS